MIQGPLGGPRPLADSERRVIVNVGVRDSEITDNMRRKLESDLRSELIRYVSYESRENFLSFSHRPMSERYSLTLPENTSNVMEIVVMVNHNIVELATAKNIEEEVRSMLNRSAYNVTGVWTVIG